MPDDGVLPDKLR